MCGIVVTEDLPTLEPFRKASKPMVALTWLYEDMRITEPTTEAAIFVLGHLSFFIYQSEVCFADSLRHVSEPSHWRWIHTCDRKVTARRAECQRSSIHGFAEAKALLLVLVLATILRQIGAFGAVLDKGRVFLSEPNSLWACN